MVEKLQRVLEIFNLKGGVIMGIWSLTMIGLSVFSVVYDKKIDGSIAALYGTAIAAFAASRTITAVKGPSE